jgi:hypothetical protein
LAPRLIAKEPAIAKRSIRPASVEDLAEVILIFGDFDPNTCELLPTMAG